MDVPVVHDGMPTVSCGTQRDVARPEQASKPLALRQMHHVALSATSRGRSKLRNQ
jgi:hypothetical protein